MQKYVMQMNLMPCVDASEEMKMQHHATKTKKKERIETTKGDCPLYCPLSVEHSKEKNSHDTYKHGLLKKQKNGFNKKTTSTDVICKLTLKKTHTKENFVGRKKI